MVTHWESSKRPLYVKTVWKDGQHHVVLHEETSRLRRRVEKCQTGVRDVKSANVAHSSNLNVTPMNLSSSQRAEPSRRCKTSINNRIKAEPVKRLRQRVSFLEDKSNALTIKSNSIDIGGCTNNESGDKSSDNITRYITYNSLLEPTRDSLSERVLVWLDLAIQNGNYFNQAKREPLRVVTAQPVAKKQHNSRHRCLSTCLGTDLEQPNKSFQVEGVAQSLRFTDNSVLRNHSPNFDEEVVVYEETNSPEMLVSSEVEEIHVPEAVKDKSDFRNAFGVKRQLHIFMPDLPKKFSDCDSSILSSKLSNCSLQKSGNSRKL